MRKLSEFKDTAAPIMQGQIGGSHAIHRGGGVRVQTVGEPISVSAALETAGKSGTTLGQTGSKSQLGGKKKDIFGKKNVSKKLKIEYGSTMKPISSSGVTISKGNYQPSTPGIKVANILNPERYAMGNPMHAGNKMAMPNPSFTPRPAPKVAAPRPQAIASRAAQSVGASKVPMAMPARTAAPGLGGPVSS
jgi:hypothetical protein